ncbi:MAG: hypothetical protein R2877_06335 [Bdellovibrionota bacterium]
MTLAVFPGENRVYNLFVDKDICIWIFRPPYKGGLSYDQNRTTRASGVFDVDQGQFPFIQQVKILAEHEDTQASLWGNNAQQPFSLKDL